MRKVYYSVLPFALLSILIVGVTYAAKQACTITVAGSYDNTSACTNDYCTGALNVYHKQGECSGVSTEECTEFDAALATLFLAKPSRPSGKCVSVDDCSLDTTGRDVLGGRGCANH